MRVLAHRDTESITRWIPLQLKKKVIINLKKKDFFIIIIRENDQVRACPVAPKLIIRPCRHVHMV